MAGRPPLRPLAAQHLAQARRNRDLFREFAARPADRDWALVFLFYSALHLVQAYAVQHRARPLPYDHESRKEFLANRAELQELAETYAVFFHQSRMARYRLWVPTEGELKLAEAFYYEPIRERLAELGVVI
jgi:serine acetyltransferase